MKTGDLVEIKDGVHDDAIPRDRRDGIIVEVIPRSKVLTDPDQAVVMFSNGSLLKFHISQLNFLVKL